MSFPIFAKLSFSSSGVQSGLDKTSSGFRRLQNAANKTNAAITSIGQGLRTAAFATAPFAAGVGLATKTFAEFEKQMSVVKSLTGDVTDVAFAGLRAEAKRLGATTAFSAKQAAEGMQFLALAGFDTQEQIGATAKVLSLAAAGSLDLGAASDIATDSMSALAPALKNVEGRTNKLSLIVDKFAFIQSKTNTNVLQLGEAIKFGGSSLAGFGVPLDEIIAGMGALANAGLKGSIGGTSLTNMFNKLIKPTSKGSDIIETLGIKLTDTSGKLLSMPDLIKNLSAGLDKIKSPTKRSAAAIELFGIRGIRAFNALKNEGSENIQSLMDGLVDSTGTSAKQAAIRLDNLAGAFTILQSSTEGILIEVGALFGDVFKGPIQFAAKQIGGLAQAFQIATGQIEENSTAGKLFFKQFENGPQLIEFAKGFIAGFKEATVIIKSTIITVKDFFTSMTAGSDLTSQDIGRIIAKIITFGAIAAPIFGALAVGFLLLPPIISGIAILLGIIATSFSVLSTIAGITFSVIGAIIGTLLSPIGLVVAAIVLLGSFIFTFRDEIATAFQSGTTIVESFLNVFIFFKNTVISIFKDVINFVSNIFTEVMKGNFLALLSPIKKVINGIGSIKGAFGTVKSFFGFGDESKINQLEKPFNNIPENRNLNKNQFKQTSLEDFKKAALVESGKANKAATQKSGLVSPVPAQDINISLPEKSNNQPIRIENILKIDGDILARSIAQKQVELTERKGVVMSPNEKRNMILKGATANKGEL